MSNQTTPADYRFIGEDEARRISEQPVCSGSERSLARNLLAARMRTREDADWVAKIRDHLDEIGQSLLDCRGSPVDARRLENWAAEISSVHGSLGPIQFNLAFRSYARAPED